MLEVSPKTRPNAAMILEDTWLCAIEETPSTKIRERMMNRERSLNGEVQVKAGRRRHSSNWSHTESGNMGRRKSKEGMDNLLYLKRTGLKASTYGVDSTGPTPALTPTLSLTSVGRIESVENSKRISSQKNGQYVNSSHQSSKSDADYDIDSDSIFHDHADGDGDADADAGAVSDCLPDNVSDPAPAPAAAAAPAAAPHHSPITTTAAALSAVPSSITPENNATTDHHSVASISHTNTANTAIGLDMGSGAGAGSGQGSTVTIESIDVVTKDKNNNKYEENGDISAPHSSTTSTLYTTSSTLFIRNILSSPYNDVMSLHAYASSFPDYHHDTLSGAECSSSSTGNVPRCFEDLAVVTIAGADADKDVDVGVDAERGRDRDRDRDRDTEGDGDEGGGYGVRDGGGGGGEGNGVSSQSHMNQEMQSGSDRKKSRKGDLDGGSKGDKDKIVTKEIVMG